MNNPFRRKLIPGGQISEGHKKVIFLSGVANIDLVWGHLDHDRIYCNFGQQKGVDRAVLTKLILFIAE